MISVVSKKTLLAGLAGGAALPLISFLGYEGIKYLDEAITTRLAEITNIHQFQRYISRPYSVPTLMGIRKPSSVGARFGEFPSFDFLRIDIAEIADSKQKILAQGLLAHGRLAEAFELTRMLDPWGVRAEFESATGLRADLVCRMDGDQGTVGLADAFLNWEVRPQANAIGWYTVPHPVVDDAALPTLAIGNVDLPTVAVNAWQSCPVLVDSFARLGPHADPFFGRVTAVKIKPSFAAEGPHFFAPIPRMTPVVPETPANQVEPRHRGETRIANLVPVGG